MFMYGGPEKTIFTKELGGFHMRVYEQETPGGDTAHVLRVGGSCGASYMLIPDGDPAYLESIGKSFLRAAKRLRTREDTE